jgi:hypothetical protein
MCGVLYFITMAENKKSFILYSDLLHTIDLMPDENAGKLFKHILKYVNDLNPEADDLITKLSFEPIKQQLKRDLCKWEDKSVNRSESGRLGGLKSGEARRSKMKQNEANALNSKQNEHVSVNVNVNDNVILEPKVLSDFEKTFEDFRSMRNKIRKPMTSKAEELVLSKLQKMCGSNELLKIKLLNQSIINCWQDIYDIKIEKQQNKIDTPDISKIQKY